jgi:hypothetical protein
MITRYALFEGSVHDGRTAAFRDAVLERLVPLWRQFAGAQEVRVMFGEERDEGAPDFPLILAISYPNRAALEQAMASPARAQSREVTAEIVAEYFTGRIHHHVTTANTFAPLG